MSKYKVGDKVRIIRALGSSVECGLKYGDETEIIQTCQSSSGHTDYILRCPDPLYVGDGGFFLEHEIEPVVADRPQNKKQKHIFVRVDKPIEPGDLVRCVSKTYPCKVGDIRKAKQWDYFQPQTPKLFQINNNRNRIFVMYRKNWEVVHKLKVGDLVEFDKDGEPMEVTAVYPERNGFNTQEPFRSWYATNQFRLYQNSKTEWDINMFPIEPVNYGLNKIEPNGEAYGTDWAGVTDKHVNMQWENPFHNNSRPGTMKTAVAEMIVELLDKDKTHDGLFLTSLEDHKIVGVNSIDNKAYKSTLSPSDTWDTLTGLYVALSKATNRKLPDWIYGKEDKRT